MLSSIYGFLAAVTWGAGDFTGGVVSRKSNAYKAALYGYTVGVLLMVAAQLALREPVPGWTDIGWSFLAGLLGASGLMLLFRSFAEGKMSIAAPVSALMAAVLPVIESSISEGLPGWLRYAGFVLALAAIWLISRGDEQNKAFHLHLADLRLPLLAGVFFGLYFISIHQGSQSSTVWPLLVARASGALLIFVVVLARREVSLPGKNIIALVLLNAGADLAGNAFFVLAGQAGRLDVASVLGSLYPGMTVLLAALILHEKLNRRQWIGIAAALTAIVFMTV